jgi:hypothetical protein
MQRNLMLCIAIVSLTLLVSGCITYGPKQRIAFADGHPELTHKERSAILDGKIYMGCSRKVLIASWGPPNKINKTVTRYGVHEQFVYGTYSRYGSPNYVYVEDGKVTSWQN